MCTGRPVQLLKALDQSMDFKRPVRVLVDIVRSIGIERLKPIALPPPEALPRWRRIAEGLRHSKKRDAEAIHHHYDVSNAFYEWVLGPSMTYTCAYYPNAAATLEEAQENKYRLVFREAQPQGRRPVCSTWAAAGAGWCATPRALGEGHRGRCPASRPPGRREPSPIRGLSDLAEVRHSDYRDVRESGFDAVSSIGLTSTSGGQLPVVLRFPEVEAAHRRPPAQPLHHRPDNKTTSTGGFIDRYVFPDGELTGSGRIITAMQNVGLEVTRENLRHHYALTPA